MSKTNKRKKKSNKRKGKSQKEREYSLELLPEGTRTLPELNMMPMLREATSLVNLSKREIDLTPCNSITLLKSSVVLATACWEAYLEDAVTQAFDFLICKIPNPEVLPKYLKKIIAESIKKDKNELKVWDLAGAGWQDILIEHKSKMIEKFVGHFNTPKLDNIDKLFLNVIGIHNITESLDKIEDDLVSDIRSKLNTFLSFRHQIAHGSIDAPKFTCRQVEEYIYLIIRSSITIGIESRKHVEKITGEDFSGLYKGTRVLIPDKYEGSFNLPLVFKINS